MELQHCITSMPKNGLPRDLFVDLLSLWMGVIISENFMEDKLTVLCCYLLWNFHWLTLSVCVIFRKNWLQLKLKIFIRFVESSCHQFVDKHAVPVRRKNLLCNLFVKVRDEVPNVFVKGFLSRNGMSALRLAAAAFSRHYWSKFMVAYSLRTPQRLMVTAGAPQHQRTTHST